MLFSAFKDNTNKFGMSKIVVILMILLEINLCQDAENFTYSQTDNLFIKPRSSIGIYGTLSTVADEYLSSSSINITTEI